MENNILIKQLTEISDLSNKYEDQRAFELLEKVISRLSDEETESVAHNEDSTEAPPVSLSALLARTAKKKRLYKYRCSDCKRIIYRPVDKGWLLEECPYETGKMTRMMKDNAFKLVEDTFIDDGDIIIILYTDGTEEWTTEEKIQIGESMPEL